MKRRIITILLLIPSFILSSCQKPSKDNNGKIEGKTILERLKKLDRVSDIEVLSAGDSFKKVYLMNFKQYIDHDNKDLGYFTQRVELGFNGFELPTAYVSEGYMLPLINNSNYATENEIAFLLGSNYLFVEHRYFGESLPIEIDYGNNSSWQYLTTAQAASDAHEIVTEFKRILDGKWISTGVSKGGMTTELYASYYPGDMDLYLPYVAPFCNSFEDLRMIHFLDNETGNVAYGETKAAEMRQAILDFQIKMLKYRDILAPRFYQDGLSSGAVYSNYATADNIYDASVMEFEVGFWQYYQSYNTIKSALAMKENTSAQISAKREACYQAFTSVVSASDMAINNDFTPYYIQAYQELGNYGYDFTKIRNNLPTGVNLSISSEEETELMWKLILNENQLALPKKQLVYTKINNMLETTNDNFIIIYGSSDPWYAVRPNDVTGRDNISIYVNPNYPHTTSISNFPTEVKNEIINKIKTILEIE